MIKIVKIAKTTKKSPIYTTTKLSSHNFLIIFLSQNSTPQKDLPIIYPQSNLQSRFNKDNTSYFIKHRFKSGTL